MRKTFIFFISLIIIYIHGQHERTGSVHAPNHSPLENVLIINTNTGQKTHSDKNGKFSINAKINEELRLVKEGYERIIHLIKSPEPQLSFQMQKAEVVIQEVIFSKKNSDQIQKSIGVRKSNPNEKQRLPVTEVKDVLLPILLGQLNLQGIQDLVTGDSRRRKTLYKYEDLQDHIAWIKYRIASSFFTEKGVPEERISEFLTYAISQKPEITTYIKAKNIQRVEWSLEPLISIYTARLQQSKKE